MDLLLEVGLVEALAAALFIGFCLFISYLLQPRKIYERQLAKMLDQIAQPERSAPSKLTYRGAPYSPSFNKSPEGDTAAPSESSPPSQSVQIPQSVVRLSYRGVPYIQVKLGPEQSSSAETDSK